VQQLLDHTSGIPSWEFDPEWIRHGRGAEMDVSHTWGKTEALDYLKSGRDKSTHEPGLGYGYSNTNYTLLGLIIEKVTGRQAVTEVHERILAPLGLMDVRFEGFEPVDESRLPSRYHFGTADFLRDAGMHSTFPGVHAAAFTALIRASRRRDAWLGGAAEGEDSFPQTDGEHLAADKMFFAALTSRS
jgi:D-alanyl-D-alanine carboxypeptidase